MKILAENVVTGSQRNFETLADLKSWLHHRCLSVIMLRRWHLYRYVSDARVVPMPHGIVDMYDFSVYYNV